MPRSENPFRDACPMGGYVYMTASKKHGTIYIGVTADLSQRIYDHKQMDTRSFTAKYGVTRLVWYEEHEDIRDAIQREKSLKRSLRNNLGFGYQMPIGDLKQIIGGEDFLLKAIDIEETKAS